MLGRVIGALETNPDPYLAEAAQLFLQLVELTPRRDLLPVGRRSRPPGDAAALVQRLALEAAPWTAPEEVPEFPPT
jgi:hypothetical protein